MPELCFATNMTSQEWAAWVQAIGSILAILAAVGVAGWQHYASTRQLQQEREDRAWRQRAVARYRMHQVLSLIEKLMTTDISISLLISQLREAEIPLTSDEIGELPVEEIAAIMEAAAAVAEIVAISPMQFSLVKPYIHDSGIQGRFSSALAVIEVAFHSR